MSKNRNFDFLQKLYLARIVFTVVLLLFALFKIHGQNGCNLSLMMCLAESLLFRFFMKGVFFCFSEIAEILFVEIRILWCKR